VENGVEEEGTLAEGQALTVVQTRDKSSLDRCRAYFEIKWVGIAVELDVG